MFRPGPSPDLERTAKEREELNRKVDVRMVELLESSRKSVEDSRDIRQGIADIRRRIERDPFLIVGRDGR